MLKKLGITTIALAGLLGFAAPKKADAKVHFGVYVGAPAYTYPYAYAPYYGYSYPYYGYPAYGPAYGFGIGGWGHEHHDFHGHEFHGEHGHRR
jgi:hypothetical protein